MRSDSGYGEDAHYLIGTRARWPLVGSVCLALRRGRQADPQKGLRQTKAEVKDKLRELHSELDAGIRTSAAYTVEQAVTDWLREGRDGP